MDSLPAINHPRALPRGAKLTNGLVYFITYDNASWRTSFPVIKIGYTTDLIGRLKSLSTGSPIGLLVAATIQKRDCVSLERYFHSAFRRERLNGEWFKLTPGMVKIIRTHPLIDDRFDELFDLERALDAKDFEILELRKTVSALQCTVNDLQTENARLDSANSRESIRAKLYKNNIRQFCKGKC